MTVKVHNSSLELKAKQRELTLATLGDAKAWRVLETHGGRGLMAQKVYADAALRVSVDTDEETEHNVHVAAEDFLRAVDLQKFNVFDVDPYGAPWECLWLIGRRRTPTEPIVIFLTSGDVGGINQMKATPRSRGWSAQMFEVLGDISAQALVQNAEWAARKLITAWFKRWRIAGGSSARSANGKVFYYAVRLEPLVETPPTSVRRAGSRRTLV